MASKKILVTGGTGYIGSHTVVELIQAGFEVLIIDNLSNSREDVLSGFFQITRTKPGFFCFDLCDRDATRKFFRNQKVDAVIHFAALKAVGDSVKNPLLYYHNNLVSLINTVDGCLHSGVNNFVFSSSCTVYGQPDKLPVDENAALKKAESPYGNTKKISEDIIRDATGVAKFNAVSLRYFNPVGAHPSALIGEYPIGKPTNLMPVITQTAIGKNKQLEIFGNDYSTPDGTCIRDYIHVKDVADAHVIAVKRLLEQNNKSAFEVFNLGTGKGISVMEMVNEFVSQTGIKLIYKITGRREGDVEKVYADIRKIKSETGWQAKYGLKEMIESSWKWEQALAKKNILSDV